MNTANERSNGLILLVEDDEKLANLVKDYLTSTLDHEVAIESRGDTATTRILDENPDLVILDIMLPGKNGIEVCREVRNAYKGPILMLTALGDEVDEVIGLEIGADDYVAKPASPRLLSARVRTLLRRFERAADPDGRQTPKRIKAGRVTIDASERCAWIDDSNVALTTAEFDLLWFLAENAGQVVSREQLYHELRGIEWDGVDRSIDLRIARLRKKLGDDATQPEVIKSVRGTGYQLSDGGA